ncbi:MAG: DNA polymerase III subunit alpha [Actinomycetia bacterium]|nr:DNA polymerase III subunit alpha [Actinomycetes bacterium]
MTGGYVELHAKSFYSFGAGASHSHELLARAKGYGYPALALTDTNLCGALEFARLANSLGVRPVTGGELTLTDGSRLVLLAATRRGYSNLCRLFTEANTADRRHPRLDPAHLPHHSEGLILLTGGRGGPLSRLLADGRRAEARGLLNSYLEWFGPGSVYLELNRNLLRGDTERNRGLAGLAREAGVGLVASNDVHYHTPDRYRLQQALAAAKRNTTIEGALPHIRPNHHLCLKSQAEMESLFREHPDAVANTLGVAERCVFNLATDLGYTLPEPPVPDGHTPDSHLERLCRVAARRRYGNPLPHHVEERLREELRLIRKHRLAGFLLLYRQIALIARQIMVERGTVGPGTPVEERPPGRGRGSSVALLAGYLIGISHVDPLKWNLTLERFIPEDVSTLPDIDLDFPRSLRDELIRRVHQHFGPDYAVLAGAVSTYSTKGIIHDLGKALGLPREHLSLLSRQLHPHTTAADLREQMTGLPFFSEKVEAPGWRDLAALAPQLIDAPKGLGQHVGGMVLSSSPIPEMVPTRAGATQGRRIIDWDKDSVADAGFAKIDLLSLPVLDQIEEALDLIEEREGKRPDLADVDPEDHGVYDLINKGLCKGVFLLQSPAQLKMGQRLKSRNLQDLAYQVALIRPGVGVQGSAVSQFVERYRRNTPWDYDHPLEQRALKRGYGIIIWQEQAVQLITDVAGMTAAEADELRRAFTKPNNEQLIAAHRQRFLAGAHRNRVPPQTAEKVFAKINGHYMFPESHSHAFAITAYQAAWLKRYHPLEFYTALLNNQPMGFYPLETIKQDARRFRVPFLNPCINRSQPQSTPHHGAVLLGLDRIKDVGEQAAVLIVAERRNDGPYTSAGDLVRRTGLKPQALLSLIQAGALDNTTPNRRQALWEAGLPTPPTNNGQQALPTTQGNSVPPLADLTDYEKMASEYQTLGIYPKGHLMDFLRPTLDPHVLPAAEVERRGDGELVTVAGWPIARQHPKGQDGTVFVTIEDETGDTQLILWPRVYTRHRRTLESRIILAQGTVSRWDGTTNTIVTNIQPIHTNTPMPPTHN